MAEFAGVSTRTTTTMPAAAAAASKKQKDTKISAYQKKRPSKEKRRIVTDTSTNPDHRMFQDATQDSGRPLDNETRLIFESAFGYDFGKIRIHDDDRAAQSAAAIYADAYTIGQDIFFAQGMYRPDTVSGRKLLAHELTHAVQQRTAAEAATNTVAAYNRDRLSLARITSAHDSLESEARRISEHVALKHGLPSDTATAISVTNLSGEKIISRQISRSAGSSVYSRPTDIQIVSFVAETIVHSLEEDPSDKAGRVRKQLAGLNQSFRQLVLDRLRNQIQADQLEFVQELMLLSAIPAQDEQETKQRQDETTSFPDLTPRKDEKEDSEEEDEEVYDKAEQQKKLEKGEEQFIGLPTTPKRLQQPPSADLIEVTPENGEEEIAETPELQKGAAAKAREEGVEAAAAEEQADKPIEQKQKESETKDKKKSPASPDEDPAFKGVLKKVSKVARQQGHKAPSAAKRVKEAQAAARGPPNEVASQAAAAQVGKMDAQEPQAFDRGPFKKALLEKIKSITPKTQKEADEFKETDRAGSIKTEVISKVGEGKEQAQGPIKEATEQPPDPSVAQPKQVTPLPPADAGPPPPNVGAVAAAPKPKTASEVSLEEGSQSLQQQLTDANITEEQLQNSNEPEFQGALAQKKEAQTHAKEAPVAYRQDEQAILAGAQTKVVAGTQQQLQAMHGTRADQFGQIANDQVSTKTVDEQKRKEVSDHIEGVYQKTKSDVEKRLTALDDEVNSIFDKGAEQAKKEFEDYVDRRMTNYKIERYLSIPVVGQARWIKDQFAGLPDEVNDFYDEGRDLYINRMDAVIDKVASAVETGLNEAKDIIAAGRQEVEEYVAKQPEDLKQVAEEAADKIQSKFDELGQSVDQKKDQLVDSLAQKYVDNLTKVGERINQMKEENRGLVDKAIDAVGGVIKTILELKNMLLGVLARAAAAIEKIIKDPIGFVHKLVLGVKAGLDSFVANIGTHIQKGLMGWLLGTLANAGVQVPESFDLKSIFTLVMQVLGLTYPNIRKRAVGIVGPDIVSRLEQGAEIFKIMITQGVSGLWEYIKDKLVDLKETVIDGIKSFVIESVIVAGITWIVSLLNPASAFIKAAKAIYDIIMFFVNRGSQLMSLVNAVIDSVSAIADGDIGVAAAAVENALGKAVSPAISFLASLLGLGGISEKIQKIINKIQGPVNKAIDWVINHAVKLVKKAGTFIKGIFEGKKEDEKEKDEKVQDPVHEAKIEAGKMALAVEERGYLEDGKISRENAEKVAHTVKSQHPVFKSITVKEGGETWKYHYVGSEGDIDGAKKDEVDIDSFGPRPKWQPDTLAELEEEKTLRVETGLLAEGEKTDRRHIQAWQTMHERLKLGLNGKPIKRAVEILKRLSTFSAMQFGKKRDPDDPSPLVYEPKESSNEGVRLAGYEYLKDQYNFPGNIWPGSYHENRSKGAKFGWATRRVKEAIKTGDKVLFEENTKILEKNWYDRDPAESGKPGFKNLTFRTVKLLRKKFEDKWPER